MVTLKKLNAQIHIKNSIMQISKGLEEVFIVVSLKPIVICGLNVEMVWRKIDTVR